MKKYFLLFFIILLIGGCKSKMEQPATITEPPHAEVGTEAQKASNGETKPAINHPPAIKSLTVEPKYPKLGDVIKAEASAVDQDGNDVTLLYEWSKNGEVLKENSNTLALKTGSFKRGDKITLNVSPDDGREQGKPAFSVITIGNAPPEITSSPVPANLEDRKYTYQVTATDPDGDSLAYSLKSAPHGMTIDTSTGLIKWDVPPGFKGKAPVTISVNDGHGGEAVQSLIIEISPAQQ